MKLLQKLAHEVVHYGRRAAEMAQANKEGLEDSLLNLLRTHGDRFGSPAPEGTQLPRSVTRREDLASMVNISVGHCMRLLRRLEERGHIDVTRTSIVLRDGTVDEPNGQS